MKKLFIIVMIYGCGSNGWSDGEMNECKMLAHWDGQILTKENSICVCEKLEEKFPNYNRVRRIVESDASTIDALNVLYIITECVDFNW